MNEFEMTRDFFAPSFIHSFTSKCTYKRKAHFDKQWMELVVATCSHFMAKLKKWVRATYLITPMEAWEKNEWSLSDFRWCWSRSPLLALLMMMTQQRNKVAQKLYFTLWQYFTICGGTPGLKTNITYQLIWKNNLNMKWI